MDSVTLHPLFSEFLEKFNNVDLEGLTVDQMSEALVKSLPPPDGKTDDLFVLVHEEVLTTPDGVLLNITRPRNVPVNESLPVMIYLHGGGWCVGDAEYFKRARTEFTLRANAAVVFVNYSLSPKVRYPVALEECYNVLSWIVDTDPSIHHLDPTKIAVLGDSAGGNLAAALTILDKQRNGGKSRIQDQVLYYPITSATFETESYKKFGKGLMLTLENMIGVWNEYVPDEQERFTKSTASPLVATIDELRCLPSALIYTAEVDVLRDEGEAYAHKLIKAGVPVLATRVLGALHGFLTLDPSISIAVEIYDQTANYLNRQWKRQND